MSFQSSSSHQPHEPQQASLHTKKKGWPNGDVTRTDPPRSTPLERYSFSARILTELMERVEADDSLFLGAWRGQVSACLESRFRGHTAYIHLNPPSAQTKTTEHWQFTAQSPLGHFRRGEIFHHHLQPSSVPNATSRSKTLQTVPERRKQEKAFELCPVQVQDLTIHLGLDGNQNPITVSPCEDHRVQLEKAGQLFTVSRLIQDLQVILLPYSPMFEPTGVRRYKVFRASEDTWMIPDACWMDRAKTSLVSIFPAGLDAKVYVHPGALDGVICNAGVYELSGTPSLMSFVACPVPELKPV
ncbi:hypothetical protein BDN72DRAFT_864149 [Pluteus cervinus]|uniref:Uncharacterized protein n=1 Tax=Pluteus cervinus TaxID=181527 RepID=A0ACD3A7A7_9AGAR|nr:hypothetical protein BDN72DRAFT_864149 [Pluteus cervinus]